MKASRLEVADRAGVSVRTVSNVVNGYEHVAPATRERVLGVVEELGYRPSGLARGLKTGRSGLLALVLPEVDTPYFAELTRAFVDQAAVRGITVVVDQTNGDAEREREFVHRVNRGALFDAVVISPLGLLSDGPGSAIRDIPVVFLGEDPHPGFDHVAIDNRAAAAEAVAHLVEVGSRRIGAIGAEQPGRNSSGLRLSGYRDALAAAGIPVDERLIEHVARFSRAEGAAAMGRLLDREPHVDGVFCFSDPLALGALRTLADRRVRVPDDVAVVGFDDIEDGRFSVPRLSTVSPDKDQIARVALDMVFGRLNDREAPVRVESAPYRMVPRESSARR